jgi:subtilase family serine protease
MIRNLTLMASALGALLLALPNPGAAAGSALVTQAVDESKLVTLTGNTRPEAIAANDRGRVVDNLPLEHMQLLLHRSPADEAAVERFVDSLQDRSSPNFHQWLSAAEFGARFGTGSADIANVTSWLHAHGFTVNYDYPSHMVIDFSGTAGQVAEAFHTEIHHLSVNGVAHIANMRDPEIPAALKPVIAGIVWLSDFRPRPQLRRRPEFTGTSQYCDGNCYWMAPADLAKIYNFTPLFSAASPITGKGQTIAVVEDTNLYSTSDWTKFRSIFGLTTYKYGKLETLHPLPADNCRDPGVQSGAGGDDIEATLDVEWSSAAAPDATIILASCDNSNTTDGVYVAIQNLVNEKAPPPVISVSYGDCEADEGAGANAALKTLYQQAVAEGISVFVATGDSGPTDCYIPPSDGKLTATTVGIGVSGWASTVYNTAVGGTDFSDTYSGTNSKYWTTSTGKPWGSAKSYVPETPWNDSCAGTLVTNYYQPSNPVGYGSKGFCNTATGKKYFLEPDGGEGGPSACATGTASTTDVVSGTCKGWPKPSWQSLVGVPKDGVRDLPDVSMFAADGLWNHQYLLCFSDPNNGGAACSGNPGSWGAGGGGTSYAAPIVAGIQALINQKMGKSQGNAAPVLYKLARLQYGSKGNANCDANKGASSSTNCIFHDVTFGDDIQPCKGKVDCYLPSGTYGVLSTSDTKYDPAYVAGVGYDLPTGIGTINAYELVEKWAGGL